MDARQSRWLLAATVVGVIVLVVAFAATRVDSPSGGPSQAAVSPSPGSSDPDGSVPGGSLPSGGLASASAPPSPSTGATASPSGGLVSPPSVVPFTPPPAMEPQDDEVCLDLAPRADVESALGLPIGDITAQGTDPNFSLVCTYPATSGGQLILSTTTDDAGTAYTDELARATEYGQDPQALDGVGDQAFYGRMAGEAPEQVVFTKGPVIVRLWNQTEATIGMEPFAALAATAAEAIRAEIPPAP